MRLLSSASIVLLISFIHFLQITAPAAAHDPHPCNGLREWPLSIVGAPADQFVAEFRSRFKNAENDEELRNAFASLTNFIRDDLGIDLDLDELISLLTELNETDPLEFKSPVPVAMQGVSGLPTTLLLQMLLPPDAPPIAEKVLYGKIRDYTFEESTGRGHLSVDICIDRKTFVSIDDEGKPNDIRQFFHWDIEVSEGKFNVATRKDPAPNDLSNPSKYGDPFPGFQLPVDAVDPANPKSLWRRGLDHKLTATGQAIKVNHVYYRSASNPELARLPDTDHRYETTDESCIDLFTSGFPPGTLGELASGGYCLGRCASPPIVNSGD